MSPFAMSPLEGDRPEPTEADTAPGAVAQPAALVLEWVVVATLLLSYALSKPVQATLGAMSRTYPEWSHVAGAAALGLLALCAIERLRRDRRAVLGVLQIMTVILITLALAVDRYTIQAPTSLGWFVVLAGFGIGVLHLVYFEDWIAGAEPGRTPSRSAGSHWWTSVSDVASKLRMAAPDRSPAAVASAPAIEPATSAHLAGGIPNDERLEEVRRQRRALSLEADAARVARRRLQAEQLEADRRFLEAAIAAREVAEVAERREVELLHARELLERARAELDRQERPEADDELDPRPRRSAQHLRAS